MASPQQAAVSLLTASRAMLDSVVGPCERAFGADSDTAGRLALALQLLQQAALALEGGETTGESGETGVVVDAAAGEDGEETKGEEEEEEEPTAAARVGSAEGLEEAAVGTVGFTDDEEGGDDDVSAGYGRPPSQAAADLLTEIEHDPKKLVKLQRLQQLMRSRIRRNRFRQVVADLSSKEAADFDDEMSGRRQRSAVAREIVETERSFCQQLRTLERHFLVPFRKSGLFSKEDLRAIFSNLEGIVACSESLLGCLERGDAENLHNSIGGVFVSVLPAFSIYSDYINSFDAGQRVLSQQRAKSAVQNLLRGCVASARQESGTSLDLSDLLIQPVQRLPRYVLLLQELLKSTPDDHVDRDHIVHSIERVREITAKINRAKAEHDNMEEIVAIQESLQGGYLNLIEPHRRYLHKGFLTQLWGDIAHRGRELMFFAFNDILLFAQPVRSSIRRKISRFQYESFFIFDACELVTDLSLHDGLPRGTAERALMLHYPESGHEFAMAAPTVAERDEWAKIIQEAIDTRKRGDHEVLGRDVREANDMLKVVRKAGWLTKRGENVKSWKRRFFKLKGRTLFYFSDSRSSSPLGSVVLSDQDGGFYEMYPSALRRYCVELRATSRNPNNRSYFVESSDADVLASWVEKLAEEVSLGRGMADAYIAWMREAGKDPSSHGLKNLGKDMTQLEQHPFGGLMESPQTMPTRPRTMAPLPPVDLAGDGASRRPETMLL
jgi:RhoGEF domain/PH domain/Pleckstrin homology domain